MNIKTTGLALADAEPVWGPFLLALFVIAMLFVLLNVIITMVLFAYHEAKDAIASEDLRGEVHVAIYYYYKLLHWLNLMRKVNYDTMGSEASQFNILEGELFLAFVLRMIGLD